MSKPNKTKSAKKTGNAEKNIFTPERNVRFFFVEFIGIFIAGLIIWPLIDFIMVSISGRSFAWTVGDHLVAPLIFALLITIVEFVFWNFFHREKKK